MIPITQASGFPFYMTTPNETYQLQEDISVVGSALVVGADNITVDLNGHTISFGSDNKLYRYGIALPPGYPHVNPVWSQSDLSSFPCGKSTIIVNGRIEQSGTGGWNGGIYRYGGRGITISGVTVALKGADSRPILLEEVEGPASITSCTIDDTLTRVVTNRHQGRGAIDTQVDGVTEISYCTITMSPQWGIRVAARTQEISSAKVHHNTIMHYTTCTNGYGIGAHMSNVEVYENTIVSQRGRGIHMEGGLHIHVYENIVNVVEEPEWEEYDSVTTHGIKLEECNLGLVEHNAVTAHGKKEIPHATCAGSALIVSTNEGSSNTIRDNIFVGLNDKGSIYDPGDYGQYGTPLELLAIQGDAEVIIENNKFASNDRFLVVKEYNPVPGTPNNIKIRNNSFEFLGGVELTGRPEVVFHMAGFNSLKMEDNIFLESSVGKPSLTTATTGWPWDPCLLTFTRTFSFRFRDPLTANMATAEVSFITPLGAVTGGITDAVGRIKVVLPIGYITGSDGAVYYPINSFQANIKWLGTETLVEIPIDSTEVSVPVVGTPTVINVGTNGTNMPDDIMPGDVVTLTCINRLENQPFQGTVNVYKLTVARVE